MKKLYALPYFIALIFTMLALGLSAQQDRFSWRLGIGAGNQFENGAVYNRDSVFSGNALKFTPDFLSYSAFLELSLSQDFGLKAYTTTHPGEISIINSGLLLSYYTDNDYLFGSQAFVAPYFSVGVASGPTEGMFNIPFGGGLKFRLASRININVDFMVRTYPSNWSENKSIQSRAYSSLSVHYNFGKKDQAFRAPRPYVIPRLALPEDQLGPMQQGSALANTNRKFNHSGATAIDSLAVDTFNFTAAQKDSANNAKMLERYGHLLETPKLQDSVRQARLFMALPADSASDKAKQNAPARQSAFSVLPAANTQKVEESLSQKDREIERRDSILAKLLFEVQRKSLQNELKRLNGQVGDTIVDSLSTPQSPQINTDDERIAALEQRIRQLESRSAATTTNQNTPARYSPSRYSASEQPGSSQNSRSYQAAALNTGTDIAQDAKVSRLENKIDSLQKSMDMLARDSIAENKTPSMVPDSATLARTKNDSLQQAMDAVKAREMELMAELKRAETDEQYRALQNEIEQMRAKMDSLLKALPVKEAPAPDNFFATTGKVELFFEVNSSELSTEAREKLSSVIEFAKNKPQANFLIKGFTDKTGAAAYNKKLAERRAQAVQDFLQANGIASSRFNVVSIGPDQSLQSGHQEYGRRVEVVLN